MSRSEVVDFVCPYRVGTECENECKIILNSEEMEEVNEFKYRYLLIYTSLI